VKWRDEIIVCGLAYEIIVRRPPRWDLVLLRGTLVEVDVGFAAAETTPVFTHKTEASELGTCLRSGFNIPCLHCHTFYFREVFLKKKKILFLVLF